MVKFTRTNSDDDDLAKKNGEKNSFLKQFNNVDKINHVIVIYKDEVAVGCGAFKIYDKNTIEIKRMFVDQYYRNNGFATMVLRELINWAKDLNFSFAILETGDKMHEAIKLYQKEGFKRIPNYPPYDNEVTSRCFKKFLLS